jgi:hypothetical protein
VQPGTLWIGSSPCLKSYPHQRYAPPQWCIIIHSKRTTDHLIPHAVQVFTACKISTSGRYAGDINSQFSFPVNAHQIFLCIYILTRKFLHIFLSVGCDPCSLTQAAMCRKPRHCPTIRKKTQKNIHKIICDKVGSEDHTHSSHMFNHKNNNIA